MSAARPCKEIEPTNAKEPEAKERNKKAVTVTRIGSQPMATGANQEPIRRSVTVTRISTPSMPRGQKEKAEKTMTISQVDGLVDSDYGGLVDSDYGEANSVANSTSEDTLRVWEVTDTRTWVLNELRKMSSHESYLDILNHRDDGDRKWPLEWRRRADIIIGTMNRCGLTWEDISGPHTHALMHSTQGGAAYPEWGVLEPPNGVEPSYVDDIENNNTSTTPPECEPEPDMMTSTSIPTPPITVDEASPPKRIRTDYQEQEVMPQREVAIGNLFGKDGYQYHYLLKGVTPRTAEDAWEHDKTVREELEKPGVVHKINSQFWKIRGPISREERMERVLDFWRAGDIVPRNPFLHSNLWGVETKRERSERRSGIEYLAGYSESGEDGRILADIRDESPEREYDTRPLCRFGGTGWCKDHPGKD